jgi:hypothetical protein
MLGAHPYADLFPLLDGEAFDQLVEDIKRNGLVHPIVRYQNEILDGRNRYRACEIAQRALIFTDYTGDDPLGYVISANLSRRHLDESQRAMVAANLTTLRHGQRANKGRQMRKFAQPPQLEVSQPAAAKRLRVSRRSVQNAAVVRKLGTPDLVAAVERGEIKVSTAVKLAKLPRDVQIDAVHRQERIPFILNPTGKPTAPPKDGLKALRRAWGWATPSERAEFLAEVTNPAAHLKLVKTSAPGP